MEIDLGQDVEFVIKYNGASYKMREPSVEETMSLRASTDNASDMGSVIKFLNTLGMPEPVLVKMPIGKMKKLVESMLGAIQEKK